MKLDLLVFASHPDDAELGCGGTILSYTTIGKKVGIVDLTAGELGTRGTVEDRKQEAADSAKILALSARENLQLPDGFFTEDKESLLKLIVAIRTYQPEIVLCNAENDRHPDHKNGGELASRACFLSGLAKIETFWAGEKQAAWRPLNVYHYIQDRYIKPDFIVDITPFWENKINAIRAFKSQFFNPDSKEPQTYISRLDFINFVEARSREMGHSIGATFGEGFTTDQKRIVGIKNIGDLL